jgi:ABC-type phosphate/phosphonate transport system permease subunit
MCSTNSKNQAPPATPTDHYGHTLHHKMLKSIAVAIALSLLAAIGAAILGAIAVNTLPCSWFGSGFEGGCGLGAVLFVSAASVLLAVVLAITFNVLYFRKKASRAEA